MTSFRQVEANRRNAGKSTGPVTETGKRRSRRNAVRHGLTAETVIAMLEDAEDYRRFEAAVAADFNPETAVERELVLRLAGLLWRLRRATSIETGLFQNSAECIADANESTEPALQSVAATVISFRSLRGSSEPEPKSGGSLEDQARLAYSCDDLNRAQNRPAGDTDTIANLARRFVSLAAEDKGAFERVGRYETALWRQVCQSVFMLEVLRRQKLDSKWLPRRSHQLSGTSVPLPAFVRR